MSSNVSLTPDDCKALLKHYEKMAEAARENHWDTLAELEQQSAQLRDEIIGRHTSGMPSEAEQREIAALIERILFLDGEIRSHASPVLESTRKLLSGAVRGRTVHTAYGAHGP